MSRRPLNIRPVWFFAVFTFLLLSTGSKVLRAGLSAPASFAVLSPDEKRVLVMRSFDVAYDEKHPVMFSMPGGRSIVLHEVFPKSGTYDSTSFAPIWQVDWYAFEYCLRWSPNFDDVVRLNTHALNSNWASAFYHSGRLTHQYDKQDLLTGLRHPVFFPLSTWDWYSKWYDEFEVHQNQLFLSTSRRRITPFGLEVNLGLKESYVFDLSSGTVINRSTSGTGHMWLQGVTVATCICALFFTVWYLSKRIFVKFR